MAKRVKNNWKKFSDTSRGARWDHKSNPKSKPRSVYIIPVNEDGDPISSIYTNIFVPKGKKYKRNKVHRWEWGVNSYDRRLRSKKFKTKREAREYAKNWMLKNQ